MLGVFLDISRDAVIGILGAIIGALFSPNPQGGPGVGLTTTPGPEGVAGPTVEPPRPSPEPARGEARNFASAGTSARARGMDYAERSYARFQEEEEEEERPVTATVTVSSGS